jgi:hypothetical protein
VPLKAKKKDEFGLIALERENYHLRFDNQFVKERLQTLEQSASWNSQAFIDGQFENYEHQKRQLYRALSQQELLVLPSLRLQQVRPIVNVDLLDDDLNRKPDKKVTFK